MLPSSSQAAVVDEPDLVPYVGSFSLGCTWDNGCGGGHHGTATPAIDIPMPEGTTILAAGPGVARRYSDTCAGNYVEIWHAGAKKYSRYLHLSSISVTDGATVARGQVIGASGNTGAAGGCSSGPHLHFDVLNASRSRVRPGPLSGRRSTGWVSYPQALGASDWNGVASFSGPAMANDYRVDGPTPTGTSGTTTTTSPPTTTPTTTAPPTPTTIPTTTTRPVPPRPNLAPGTLFKPADAPNVFLYAAGNAWWVPTPAQVELLGGWSTLQVLPISLDAVLTAFPFQSLDREAFVEAGNATVYWCAGGSPWPVASMGEVNTLLASAGRSRIHTLPGGAGRSQWACGATLPATVFSTAGRSDYWVWRGGGWEYAASTSALAAKGYGGRPVALLPPSAMPPVTAQGASTPATGPIVAADSPTRSPDD